MGKWWRHGGQYLPLNVHQWLRLNPKGKAPQCDLTNVLYALLWLGKVKLKGVQYVATLALPFSSDSVHSVVGLKATKAI